VFFPNVIRCVLISPFPLGVFIDGQCNIGSFSQGGVVVYEGALQNFHPPPDYCTPPKQEQPQQQPETVAAEQTIEKPTSETSTNEVVAVDDTKPTTE
jgi:hypothetical protein